MGNFSKKIKKIFTRNLVLEEEERIHPYRDWKRILTFFAILNLLVILWSIYFYFVINRKHSNEVANQEEYLKTLNGTEIEKISGPFKQREENLNKFKEGETTIPPDPAL